MLYDIISSGVTGWGRGEQSTPLTFFTGKFLLPYQEKRGKEERENGEEKKENLKGKKGRGGKLKTEGKRYEYEQRIYHTGKKLGKLTLPPLKNSPLMPCIGYNNSGDKCCHFTMQQF